MDNPVIVLAMLGAAAGAAIGAALTQIRNDTRLLVDLNFDITEADEPVPPAKPRTGKAPGPTAP
jgi:hypothetical protein